MPLATINEALEFLISIGILKRHGTDFVQGETNLFLSADSPFVLKHHLNWRMKAIQSLDTVKAGDFHYSGVITLRKSDAVKIKEQMIQAVQNVRNIVKESESEALFAYTIDFFQMLE